MYQGAFGTWFSWQNTLTRAAPLILTALCTALPAQLGMVIIGGEGALLMGALAATSAALALPGAPPFAVQIAMAAAGMIAGGLWIALAGALRQYRGVNETISSLLLVYVALALLNHLVEGPMRDPTSLNKPSTQPDRRRQHDRHDPGHRRALGVRVRNRRGGACLRVDLSHRVWIRRAGRRRKHPRRQGRRPQRRPTDFDHLLPGRAPRPGSPAWSRSRPFRAAPTPISRPAMALPASWWRSWRGTIRSRSFRSLSCSAESARAAGSCSGASACRMRPSWCCRA